MVRFQNFKSSPFSALAPFSLLPHSAEASQMMALFCSNESNLSNKEKGKVPPPLEMEREKDTFRQEEEEEERRAERLVDFADRKEMELPPWKKMLKCSI